MSGAAIPATPKQLMRSRYSAYALGGYGEYLLSTWFPATAKGLTAAELSTKQHEWIRLEIIDSEQNGDNGMVEFNAYYSDRQGEEHVLHEKSVFKRLQARWFYIGGEVSMNKSD